MDFDYPNKESKRPWPFDEFGDHLVEMGRIVFNWNNIENGTRQLLNVLAGGGFKVDIVTTHMGTAAQLDAMRTILAHYCGVEEADAIGHQLKVYEIFREYRNFFVHGFSGVSQIDQSFVRDREKLRADFVSQSAKNKLTKQGLTLTYGEMRELGLALSAFANHCALFNCHYMYRENPSSEYDRYRKLPEKFPLPRKLQKTPLQIPNAPLPPTASDA